MARCRLMDSMAIRRIASGVALSIVLAPAVPLRAQEDFVWTSRQSHPRLWALAGEAVSTEVITSSDPSGSGGQLFDRWGPNRTPDRIEAVGVQSGVLLIVYGEGEMYGERHLYFSLFSVDTVKASVTKIIRPQHSRIAITWPIWRFERLARLTSTSQTTVLFSFHDCAECEAAYWLGAVELDTDREWKVRPLGENGLAIFIGSDLQYGGWSGGESFWLFDCAYAVDDLDEDQLDEVGTVCRTVRHDTVLRDGRSEVVSTDTTVKAMTADFTPTPIHNMIEDEVDQQALLRRLCMIQTQGGLCPP